MSFTAREIEELRLYDAEIDLQPDVLTEAEEAAARHLDAVAEAEHGGKTENQFASARRWQKNRTPEQIAKQNAWRKAQRDTAMPDECLIAFRIGTGLSRPRFAEVIGVPYSTYTNWERGFYNAKDNIIGNTFGAFWAFREKWKGES